MAKIRKVAIAAGCLVVGPFLFGHHSSLTTQALAAVIVPAEPEVVPSDPTPPPPPPPPVEETPYRLVLGMLDTKAYPDVEVRGSVVHVRYRLGPIFSVRLGRRTFDQNVAQIVPGMFAKFPHINTITIAADAPTIDIRGNEGRAPAADVKFTRRNAATIHWGVIDTGNVDRLADAACYDPGFR